MHNPSKSALQKRLHAERHYDDYVKLREHYKRLGIPSRLAWMAAAQSYPPAKGVAPEVPMTPEIEAAIKKVREIEAGQAAPSPQPSPNERDFYLDGSIGVAETTAPPPAAAPEVVSIPLHPKLPPPPKRNGGVSGWTDYAQPAEKLLPETRDGWLSLYEQVPAGKRASKLAMIDFWADNAGTPPDQIDPETVPNRGCLKFLQRISSDDRIYDDFMRTIWSKTIPTTKEINRAEKMTDDGTVQTNILDDIDEEFHEKMAGKEWLAAAEAEGGDGQA